MNIYYSTHRRRKKKKYIYDILESSRYKSPHHTTQQSSNHRFVGRFAFTVRRFTGPSCAPSVMPMPPPVGALPNAMPLAAGGAAPAPNAGAAAGGCCPPNANAGNCCCCCCGCGCPNAGGGCAPPNPTAGAPKASVPVIIPPPALPNAGAAVDGACIPNGCGGGCALAPNAKAPEGCGVA